VTAAVESKAMPIIRHDAIYVKKENSVEFKVVIDKLKENSLNIGFSEELEGGQVVLTAVRIEGIVDDASDNKIDFMVKLDKLGEGEVYEWN